MNTWMECPRKAAFRYVEGLPEPQNAAASFGTVVHHALQKYNDTMDLDRALEDFRSNWENPERLGVAPDIWPRYTDSRTYLERGIKALEGYHDQVRWANRTVLATEHPFLVPFGRHELTGFVDLLQISGAKKGTALEIVDYKTSSRVPFVGNLRQNVQMTVYDYASRQDEFWLGNGPEFPPMVNGAHWLEFTRDLKRVNTWYALTQQRAVDAGERNLADFMRLYRVADEIERALEHQVFVPNISGDSCGFCPYTLPCGLAIPPSEVEDD